MNVHLRGRRVLRDVWWRLEPGQHWAIVGANGSGKSTLLRVIRGDLWIDDDGGRRVYALDGDGEQSVRAAKARIGYVSPELHERIARLELGISGHELVAGGLHDTIYRHGELAAGERERVDALLARFALAELAARPLRALSFGELRRLLIARALVRAPRVLVLDEFASGVDRRARHALLAFLEEVAAQTQLVCASHRSAELPAVTTRYARIADGALVEIGEGRPPARRGGDRPAPRAQGLAGDAGDDEPLAAFADTDVFVGGRAVLRGIAWEIRRGEHTAIRGANGSGKSTFAALLAGTLPAAFGARITRFGRPGPFDLWKLKERVAHVSDALQIAYDANPTVEQVVASGFPSSIGLLEEPDAGALTTVRGLLERLGIAALSPRRFSTLSFGERRKVLIARGLVRRPDLLVLDEVWSGLDAPFRSALHALLDELAAAGTTLVLISHHDEDLPALVRRSYVIENGRLREAPG